MKNWKKVLFNLLGCGLFLLIGGVILGIILEDNELAFSICFKVILIYIFIISFVSLIKKLRETICNIKKQRVKKSIRPLTFCIVCLPYLVLWGILIALAFKNILNIALCISFISLALYIIILLIIGSVFESKEFKENDKQDVDSIEQNLKNNKR